MTVSPRRPDFSAQPLLRCAFTLCTLALAVAASTTPAVRAEGAPAPAQTPAPAQAQTPAPAATAKAVPAKEASRDPAAEFAEALESVRMDGRRSVQELLEAYARLSINQTPGITALRFDISRLTEQIHRERRAHFSVEEVDGLTLRNPNFWQAWFEFSPQDSSLLMLHSSLLIDAGAMQRASTLLALGVQAMPLSGNERMLWLTQHARVNWVLFKRLKDLETREKSWRKREARIAGLERALREWPEDAFVYDELIQLRASAAAPVKNAKKRLNDDEPIVLTPAGRRAVAEELAWLPRLAPAMAMRYLENADTARKFAHLWSDSMDEERPADDKQMTKLAELLGTLREPELRAYLVRIGAARRGFYSPDELSALEQICGERLTDSEFRELSTTLAARPSPGVVMSLPAEKPEDILPNMDGRIHPVYAEQAVRECARETFWMQAVGDNAELRAQHQWQRSVRLSNVGCFEAAMVDLEAALAVEPKRAEWLVDKAALLSKLGRNDEAEAAFTAAQKVDPKHDHLRSSLAIFRFGQGRFADAEKLYRAARRDDPNFSYTVIMAYLASARRGAPDTAWLKKNLGTARDRWPAAILKHLAGEIDRAALLEAARDDSELRTSEQQCEAFFTLGQLALARGDTATAKLEFENSEAAGIVGFIEYGLAQLELQRLEPTREARKLARPTADGEQAVPAGSTRI